MDDKSKNSEESAVESFGVDAAVIPPCPFCKNTNTELVVVFMTYSIYVVCHNCKGIGPTIEMSGKYKELEKQKMDAINAWAV